MMLAESWGRDKVWKSIQAWGQGPGRAHGPLATLRKHACPAPGGVRRQPSLSESFCLVCVTSRL